MTDPILERFAASHAQAVAAQLASAAPGEIVGILDLLKIETAARVLTKFESSQMKEVLSELSPKIIGRLLIASEQPVTGSIVAHLSTSQYKAIFEAAEKLHKTRLSRLFDLPTNTLAAWATPDFVRVLGTKTCGEVKSELENQSLGDVPVFVVDESSKYLGILTPFAILAVANAPRVTRDLMQVVRPLIGTMEIAAALSVPQWRGHSALPVVDSRSSLLGSITQDDLLPLNQPATPGQSFQYDNILASFFVALADIFAVILGSSRS